jgi:hypothetical protein
MYVFIKDGATFKLVAYISYFLFLIAHDHVMRLPQGETALHHTSARFLHKHPLLQRTCLMNLSSGMKLLRHEFDTRT